MASLFPTLVPAGPIGNAGHPGPSANSQVTVSFVPPLPDQCGAVGVSDTTWMHVGQVIYMSGEGYYEIMSVTNSTNVVLKNLTSEHRPVVQREWIHDVIDYDS